MTSSPRPLLPLVETGPHGSRSAMTCRYRCADACDQPEPNPTTGASFRDLVEATLSRRSLLTSSALTLGALAGGCATAGPAQGPRTRSASAATATGSVWSESFAAVGPNVRDAVTLPEGLTSRVVVGWGDPVLPGAPAFDAHHQTPASAAMQFGYNCDYVGFVALTPTRGLLVVNHEYTNEELMFPPGAYDTDTTTRIAMACHGMSVVEVRRPSRDTGAWTLVPPAQASYNRRVTPDTELRLDGPAAGDPRLRTRADTTGTRVRGTLANCAGGMTPWGTVLSGEENVDNYFDASGDLDRRYTRSYRRYGLPGRGYRRDWKSVDPRFDVTLEPHEPFRFGWVVEIDPTAPRSAPRKHTMLGRFKHEGATVRVDRGGRVAVYMGDDQSGEYVYKFVSRNKLDRRTTRKARRRNLRLLRRGVLYVARFRGDGLGDGRYDGRGRWVPLTNDERSFVPGMSVSDVLIDTRLAADKVGATRMDRPEDIEVNPVNGRVYCALTKNPRRGGARPTDEANPLAQSNVRDAIGAPLRTEQGNRNGYVLELVEADKRATARRFRWNLMLVCGDPESPETYFAGYPKSQVSPISCPDNLTFDPGGNLWIATDGNALGSNDGVFKVPVAGPERGHVQQFLTVPRGAEPCGPLVSRDGLSLWVAVQHPGETSGSTFEAPASTWPHTHDFPRPCVVVAFRP